MESLETPGRQLVDSIHEHKYTRRMMGGQVAVMIEEQISCGIGEECRSRVEVQC